MVRDYGADVPRIEAYAGELNQVWTNLIDNAVDAMNGNGRLELQPGVDGGRRRRGDRRQRPRNAEEVADRAFEAFYTTKGVGKGTGLGLDIARRIVVERHGGDDRHRLPPRADGAARRTSHPPARTPRLSDLMDAAELARQFDLGAAARLSDGPVARGRQGARVAAGHLGRQLGRQGAVRHTR